MPEITVEFAKALYSRNHTMHAFDHVLRVTALAETIGLEERASLEIVRTASLLHDIAKSEPNHHIVGAQHARMLLHDMPRPFVEAVSHCIEAHSFRIPPEPQTIEAKCLCDADKLDAIGAIGIARTFAFAGVYNNRLWLDTINNLRVVIGEDKVAYRQEKGGTQDYTPSHELVCKLEELRCNLYTTTARKIAGARHEYMMGFFRRLDLEALGKA